MSTLLVEPHLILGVPAQPSYEQLQKAYRAKVRLVHPDCGGSAEEFDQLHRAYEHMKTRSQDVRRHGFMATRHTPVPVKQTSSPASLKPIMDSEASQCLQTLTEPSTPLMPDPRIPEILRLLRLKMHYEGLRKEADKQRKAEETAFLARFGLTPNE